MRSCQPINAHRHYTHRSPCTPQSARLDAFSGPGNRPAAAAVDIQRVIQRELPLEPLVVADLHELEAAGDGIESSGLRREVLSGCIRPAHDEGYTITRR